MERLKLIITVLSLTFAIALRTNAQIELNPIAKRNAYIPTITITNLDVNDTSLKLSWEIRNESKGDVWILAGFTRLGDVISAFMAEDDRTLLMRRRLDLAWSRQTPFPTQCGKYIRLRKGEILTESISLSLPMYPIIDFVGGGRKPSIGYAKRLAIEIGYYMSGY